MQWVPGPSRPAAGLRCWWRQARWQEGREAPRRQQHDPASSFWIPAKKTHCATNAGGRLKADKCDLCRVDLCSAVQPRQVRSGTSSSARSRRCTKGCRPTVAGQQQKAGLSQEQWRRNALIRRHRSAGRRDAWEDGQGPIAGHLLATSSGHGIGFVRDLNCNCWP